MRKLARVLCWIGLHHWDQGHWIRDNYITADGIVQERGHSEVWCVRCSFKLRGGYR